MKRSVLIHKAPVLMYELLFVVLCPCVLWAAHFSAENVSDPVNAFRLPILTVPSTSVAPVIDGVISEGEWSRSAAVSGLHQQDLYLGGTGMYTPDRVWLAYDAEALYVAIRTERPAHAPIPKAEYDPEKDREKRVWKDDMVEVLIAPSQLIYNFVVNSKGHRGDAILRATSDTSWDGSWQTQARLTPTGWECEIRIPFATLGEECPQEGAFWRFLVSRNRKQPATNVGTLSFQTQWADSQQYSRIVFGAADNPAIQVTNFGEMGFDDVGVEVKVSSASQASPVEVEACLYRKPEDAVSRTGPMELDEEMDILIPTVQEWNFYQTFLAEGWQDTIDTMTLLKHWSESVDIPAGESKTIRWAMEGREGQYVISYMVRDAVTGKLLAARAMPFEKTQALEIKVEPWLLVAKQIRLIARYKRVLADTPNGKLALCIRDADSAQVLYEDVLELDTVSLQNIVKIPSEPYVGKKVKVTAQILRSDGGSIHEITESVQIPGMPEWLGNEIGTVTAVPPPWTPIVIEGNKAKVLLREYQIGDNGLPLQIHSRGKELLSGPVELLVGGQSLSWTRSAIQNRDIAATWNATTQTRDYTLELQMLLEFDGMLRCDLTLRPLSDAPIIRDVELSIPYRADRNLEPLPLVHEGFEPIVELGDFETGLCWAAEWSKGWHIGSKPAMEIHAEGNRANWRVRFFGEEGRSICEPVTLTWIMQALPVKEWNNLYERQRVIVNLSAREEDYLSGEAMPESMTENALRYPAQDHLDEAAGSLSFYMIPGDTMNVSQIRVFQIKGKKKLTLHYERKWRPGDSWAFKQSLVLCEGKEEIARVFPVLRQIDSAWLPVGFSWERQGQNVRVGLFTVDSQGAILTDEGTISHRIWQEVLQADEIVLGGHRSLALDEICIRNTPLQTSDFYRFTQQETSSDKSIRLLDHLDRLVFHLGRYRTRPAIIQEGIGGIAGARHTGSFVRSIEGRFGRGVALPAGLHRNLYDYAKSLGSSMLYPNHEQYHQMTGYYHPTFVPDPFVQDRYQTFLEEGFGVMFYNGMAFDDADPQIGAYMDELARKPDRLVYSARIPSTVRPVVDYYLWGLKHSIDYYKTKGLHLDGTWDCKNLCMSEATGSLWYDSEGRPHGRHQIFATREMAKRYYQLMKVYRKETLGEPGIISLHGGAYMYPMVACFSDTIKIGEGAEFSSSDWAKRPLLAEKHDTFRHCRRSGTYLQILTKNKGMPYGPNFLYLYTLLYNMSIRSYANHLYPEYWHFDSSNPRVMNKDQLDFERSELPPFDPYAAVIGVHSYPQPAALCWMLRDNFDCDEAEFIGFWEMKDRIVPDKPRVRCSAWLHQNQAMLIVAGNFNSDPVETLLQIDWDAAGLNYQSVEAFDGLTGEVYTVVPEGVRVEISNGVYRFVRIESL